MAAGTVVVDVCVFTGPGLANVFAETEHVVETTENVSSKFFKWKKIHFNIFEYICFHMKGYMLNF